ncbi:Scan domain-containing protein 3-like protein [Oopsacas minuta]|uniref:Scan domain-containing protein 3-like protein n=1 Tax=Oopsacas minuta TaxID=111878 RepID=A0AAV7KK66_9METZ|nr:Scan domain-containing protein 3-like protein [Oopsacas minuta]
MLYFCLSTVPLSNETVQRRIDEIGDDVESQLVQILPRIDHAIQIDVSTVRGNEALLMGYVRFVHEKEAKEEMLFVISLPAETKAMSLFVAVKDFYEDKEIAMKKIIQCATDGASAMVGQLLMKREIPDVIAIHC